MSVSFGVHTRTSPSCGMLLAWSLWNRIWYEILCSCLRSFQVPSKFVYLWDTIYSVLASLMAQHSFGRYHPMLRSPLSALDWADFCQRILTWRRRSRRATHFGHGSVWRYQWKSRGNSSCTDVWSYTKNQRYSRHMPCLVSIEILSTCVEFVVN